MTCYSKYWNFWNSACLQQPHVKLDVIWGQKCKSKKSEQEIWPREWRQHPLYLPKFWAAPSNVCILCCFLNIGTYWHWLHRWAKGKGRGLRPHLIFYLHILSCYQWCSSLGHSTCMQLTLCIPLRLDHAISSSLVLTGHWQGHLTTHCRDLTRRENNILQLSH